MLPSKRKPNTKVTKNYLTHPTAPPLLDCSPYSVGASPAVVATSAKASAGRTQLM